MLGVFVGLFGGQRVGHFFGGGHFGEIGHFTPILALKPQNGTFWEVEFCFWPRGRQATALRPAWGSALQPGGRESRARPLCAWGSPICEDIRVLYGVSIDADIDMRWMVAWCC